MLLHHKRFVANCPHCGQNAIQMIVFMLDQFSHIIIHAHRLFLPVLIMVTQDTMVTLMPESSNTASDRAPLSSISSMTRKGGQRQKISPPCSARPQSWQPSFQPGRSLFCRPSRSAPSPLSRQMENRSLSSDRATHPQVPRMPTIMRPSLLLMPMFMMPVFTT